MARSIAINRRKGGRVAGDIRASTWLSVGNAESLHRAPRHWLSSLAGILHLFEKPELLKSGPRDSLFKHNPEIQISPSSDDLALSAIRGPVNIVSMVQIIVSIVASSRQVGAGVAQK